MDELKKPQKTGRKTKPVKAAVEQAVEAEAPKKNGGARPGAGGPKRERVNVLAFLQSKGYDPFEKLITAADDARTRNDHALAVSIDKDLIKYCAPTFKPIDAEDGQTLDVLIADFLARMAQQGRPQPATQKDQ